MKMIFCGYVVEGTPEEIYEFGKLIKSPYEHSPFDLKGDKDEKLDYRLMDPEKYCDDLYLVCDEIMRFDKILP